MHSNIKETAGIARRDFIVMLASRVVVPSLPIPRSGITAISGRYAAEGETTWEAKGRTDALTGIFHPPHDYVSWSYGENRDEADAEYSRGYWREFERLRFLNGEYDLL